MVLVEGGGGHLTTAPRNNDCVSKLDRCEDFLQAFFLFVHCIAVCCRRKKDRN